MEYPRNSAEKFMEVLNCNAIDQLENAFKSSDEYRNGMTKEQFSLVMKEISGENSDLYSNFFETYQNENRLTWNQTLTALINTMNSKQSELKFKLEFMKIKRKELTKRDPIVKILQIRTSIYFSYTVYSKYGKTGIYDLNFNELANYHVIMTREDINRKEHERRRRNRWITDAVFIENIKKIIVTSSTRSVTIYEIFGLKHLPIFLILSLPQIPKCLTYRLDNSSKIHVHFGDDSGSIITFSFIHPKDELFRKKNNDKPTLFYWEELKNENDHVKITKIPRIHNELIRKIIYCSEENSLITCSKDRNVSCVQMFLDRKKTTITHKLPRGVSTMIFSKNSNVLITGSSDGKINLWNTLVSTPPTILEGHEAGIKGLLLLESLKIFSSISKDGTLKFWSLDTETCIGSFGIDFPCLKDDGNAVEWASDCLFIGTNGSSEGGIITIWICCHNFLANVCFSFKQEISSNFTQFSSLAPPPKQNNVFIPSTWLLSLESFKELEEKVQCDIEFPEKFKDYSYVSYDKIAELRRKERGTRINEKLAAIDQQKYEMNKHVERCAPYSALKLHDIEELKLTENLPIHSNEEKKIFEKIKHSLQDANNKDQVFSELSSSRSKSSRSSVIEFEY